ncbi:TNF receptor superfamily member 14 [Phyllostomus discolor]|nr:TNF receptor superfamily member 14 [Phyllostomus discolor]
MASCKLDEYPVWDYCCPKCRPGYRVKEACRSSKATLCVPCAAGTFTAHLNGLDECLQCRVCDPDMGLVTRKRCSSTANTECGCARGHFCVSQDTDQCAECRPHSVCGPGQQVRTAGTEHQDTVCEDCPPGTFSPNGTLAACQPWTQSVLLSVALVSTAFHPRHQLCLHLLSPPLLSLSPVDCVCAPSAVLPLPPAPHPASPQPRDVEGATDLGSPQSCSLTSPPPRPGPLPSWVSPGEHRPWRDPSPPPHVPAAPLPSPRCSGLLERQVEPGTRSADARCSSWALWLVLLLPLVLCVAPTAVWLTRRHLHGGPTQKCCLCQGNRQQAEENAAAAVQTLGVTEVLPDVTTVAVEETASMFPKTDPTADQ